MKATKKATRKPKGTAIVKRETGLPEKADQGVRAITAVDPQALLAQAIDKNLPIESMERLLAMRKEMKAEFARDQFFMALSGFQHECPVVEKKKVAKGNKFSYNYAPLEDIVSAVAPFLEKWGFSWTVKPSQTDGHVKAACFAHHRDGHEEVTEFEIPIDPSSYMSDPQKAAAALTFARRYSFVNAFGIVTKGEDNDAQPEERQDRREPIQQPRTRQPDTVPVQHEEVKPAAPTGPYPEIMQLLNSTEKAPNGSVVSIFTSNEKIDYKTQADQYKGKPGELSIVLTDMQGVVAKRRNTIKGV
jgi:hypothetical protein